MTRTAGQIITVPGKTIILNVIGAPIAAESTFLTPKLRVHPPQRRSGGADANSSTQHTIARIVVATYVRRLIEWKSNEQKMWTKILKHATLNG
jgi:hypothetical protein